MTSLVTSPPQSRIAQYWALTKPRVTQLAVFCAVIGMFLATPDLPDWRKVVFGTIGIWLLAGAAFAVNCLVEREIDSRMTRTARRPMARGEITVMQTLVFSGVIGGLGMWVLYVLVNPLSMWLTLATFVGYAVIYTMILKPATPQNIVIGGLSGAMPPALGWACIANDVPMQAWILKVTQFHVLLYTIALFATTMLPFAVGMSGWPYLISAVILGAIFLWYAWRIYRDYSDRLARKTFTFSIIYLSLLFAALLIDHYLTF